jgi:hypothetical protein
VVDCGIEAHSGEIKDYKTGIFCLSSSRSIKEKEQILDEKLDIIFCSLWFPRDSLYLH